MGSARGFTLIEILVAFTVLTLVIGTGLGVFSTGLRASAASVDYTRAVLHAESHLAELVASAEPVEDRGTHLAPPGSDAVEYAWEVRLEAYVEPGGEPPPRLALEPVVAVVSVSWDDAGKRREVVLESLVLRPAP